MTPNTMSWREYAQKPDMMLNTPNVASIYMTQLSIDHMLSMGGLQYFEELAAARSQTVYDCIDSSNGFYTNHVDADYRSRMNVVFRIRDGDINLENKFIREA